MAQQFTRSEAENIISLFRQDEFYLELELLKREELKLRDPSEDISVEKAEINRNIKNIRARIARNRLTYLQALQSGVIPKTPLKKLLKIYDDLIKEVNERKQEVLAEIESLKPQKEVLPPAAKPITYEDIIRVRLGSKSGPISPVFLNYITNKLTSVGFAPKNKQFISVIGALNRYLGKNTETGFVILKQLLDNFVNLPRPTEQTTFTLEELYDGQQELFEPDVFAPKPQEPQPTKTPVVKGEAKPTVKIKQLTLEDEQKRLEQKQKEEDRRQRSIVGAAKKLRAGLTRWISSEQKTENVLQKLYYENKLAKLSELTGITPTSIKTIEKIYNGLVNYGIFPKTDKYADVMEALISISGGYNEDTIKQLIKEFIKRSKQEEPPKRLKDFFIDQSKFEQAIKQQQEEQRVQSYTQAALRLKELLQKRIVAEEKTINNLQQLYEKNEIKKIEQLVGITKTSKVKIKNLYDGLVSYGIKPKSESFEDVIEALISITGGYKQDQIQKIAAELAKRGKKGKTPSSITVALQKQEKLESKIEDDNQKAEELRQKEILKAAGAISKNLSKRIRDAKKAQRIQEQQQKQQLVGEQQQILKQLEELTGLSRTDKDTLKKVRQGLIRQGITPESGRFEDIAKAIKENYGRYGDERVKQIARGLVQRGEGRQQTYKKFAKETKTEQEKLSQKPPKKKATKTPSKPGRRPSPLKEAGISTTGQRERFAKKLDQTEKEKLDANLIKKYGKKYENSLITSFRAKNVFAKSIHEQTVRLNDGLIDLFGNIDKLLTDDGKPPNPPSTPPTGTPPTPTPGPPSNGGTPQSPNPSGGGSSPSSPSGGLPPKSPTDSPSGGGQPTWFDQAKDSFFPGFDELKEQTKQKRVDNAVGYGKELIDTVKDRFIGKQVSSTTTKVVQKEVGEVAAKGIEKAVGKTATEAAGKSLGKKIPGASILLGGAFAAERAAKGDWIGALGELTSGIASTIPGIGTLVSVGIDASLAGKDILSDSRSPVPAMAAGGIVTNPTLALIGEGSEPEYIIPRSGFFETISNTMQKLGGDLFSFSPAKVSAQQLVGLTQGLLSFVGGPANLIGTALGSTFNYLTSIFKSKPVSAGGILEGTDKLNPNKGAIQSLVDEITKLLKESTSSLTSGLNIPGLTPGGAPGETSQDMMFGDAPPEVNAMLEAISGGEGSWDSVNPNTSVPGLSNMTISQARQAAMNKGYSLRGSAAMGKWQQMPQYILGRARDAGLNPDVDKFSPENQYKLARALMASVYPGGEQQLVIDARANPLNAASKLRGTWPSLPGGSQENTDAQLFLTRYRQNVQRFQQQQAEVSTGTGQGALQLELHADAPGGKSGLIESLLDDSNNPLFRKLRSEYGPFPRGYRDLGGPKRGLSLLELIAFNDEETKKMQNPRTRAAFVDFHARRLFNALKDYNGPVNLWAGHADLTRGETGTSGTVSRSIDGKTTEQLFNIMVAERVGQLARSAGKTNITYTKSIVANEDADPNNNWNRAAAMRSQPRPQAAQQGTPSGISGIFLPARGIITSNFGPRWGREHKGMDIAGPVGTPIITPISGMVTYARFNNGGFGNLIEIKNGNMKMLFAHLSEINVREGYTVTAGTRIGAMGRTGRSTGPHLHWEVHINGTATDPRKVLSPNTPSRPSSPPTRQSRQPTTVPITVPQRRQQQPQQPQLDFRMIYQNPVNTRIYNGFSPVPQIPTGARF